jgi:FtsH-binding integral membrane protein
MRNSRAIIAMVGVTFVIAIGAIAGTAANAAIVPTIGLGTAASFSVLAGTPVISSTGLTTIDRDVGIHPAAAITGFPPGIIAGAVHAADGIALQAKNDLTAPTGAPTVAPAATPVATAASSVTPTTAPTAAPIAASVPTAAPVAVAGTQGLPATSSRDPSGPLTMLGVALTGIGIILLRGRPVRHL